MKRKSVGQEGFTLVELLIALTIFAIGLLSIAGMQITALRGNSSANTLTAATALAEGVMEELLAWEADDPVFASDSASPIDWDFGGGATQTTIAGAGKYSATYSIDIDYNGVNKVIRVEVVVTGGGRTLSGDLQRTVTLVGFKRAV